MTPEHRRVAAFLLRDEQASAAAGEARAPLPGAEAASTHGARKPRQKVWAWVRNRHNSRDFVAFAALLKLSLILLTLTAFAPEFHKSVGNRRPAGAPAASIVGRAAPGVPVRAAEEPLSMQSVKRSVVSGCVALPLLFASGAVAQGAVEWKVSDGGNGHWYQVEHLKLGWNAARTNALAHGADLAALETNSELEWMLSWLPLSGDDFLIGGYQLSSASSPAGGWVWLSGDPVTGLPLECDDNPCGVFPNGTEDQQQDFLHLCCDNQRFGDINDIGLPGCSGTPARESLIEWSIDCNGDGIVDYGQILSGELADSNGNGVPDCCEDGSACVSSLVANASFEAGSPLAACASESINAPNMLGSAWQVSAGTVDRVRGGTACANSTQPKFGDYAVDLCGTPASSGAIRQIVATIPGHKYRCTFWLSGDASAGPATKKVHAKVGTYIDLSYTFACSGTGAQAWVANQFEFTARGASETIEFAADNGVTTGGPMLDAINLADITTQCVGDIDASGEVDGADISLLLLNFGPCSTTP